MVLLFKWSAQLGAILSVCLWAVIVAGCSKPTVVGLHPYNPPVTRKGLSLLTDFVKVDTLTPTFRWQPLTIKVDPSSGQGPAQIDNITYEIRIWRTVSSNDGKLVYRREQLTATEHRPEQPLDPGTRYSWSVRGHFEIDGQARTTEWALAGFLLRSDSVPNESCMRFKTPEKPDTILKVKTK